MPRLMANLRERLNRSHYAGEPGPNASASPDVMLYVVGGSPSRNSVARDFPLVNRRKGESKRAHLERVTQLVAAAIAAGGTHLLIPREQADWLGDHPLVTEYFAENHEMVEANAETGIVFALYPHDRGRSRRQGGNSPIDYW
jgi:hypothetical protein